MKLSRRCYKISRNQLHRGPVIFQCSHLPKKQFHTSLQNPDSLQELFQAQEKSYFTPLTEIAVETHTSVMPNEVLNAFSESNKFIIDATFGSGGHSEKLLSKYKNLRILGLDLDPESVNFAKALKTKYPNRFDFKKTNFKRIREAMELSKFKELKPDGILYDFGFSSNQMDQPMRGFSLMKNGPLDMRFDNKRQKLTAGHVVNFATVEQLERIIQRVQKMSVRRRNFVIFGVLNQFEVFEKTTCLAQK